jgi:phenylalanyl-tRNA synthetase beta chain
VGKVFRATPAPLGSERMEAALLLTGSPEEWDRPAADPDRYLELRGVVEALAEALGIDSLEATAYHGSGFESGSGASLVASGTEIGRMGQVAAALAAAAGLDRPAWAATLDLDAVRRVAPGTRRFRPMPRFPVSKRDLAVVVSRETTHGELERAIREAGAPLLERARLFDVFEGGAIGAGKKSLAYALEFRSPERTLSDSEVEAALAAIVRAVESRFGAVRRGAPSEMSGVAPS